MPTRPNTIEQLADNLIYSNNTGFYILNGKGPWEEKKGNLTKTSTLLGKMPRTAATYYKTRKWHSKQQGWLSCSQMKQNTAAVVDNDQER